MSSAGSSSAYAFKPGGSLKLKGDDGKKDKKKKKKVKSSLSHDAKHASQSASSSKSKAHDDGKHSRDGDEGSDLQDPTETGPAPSSRRMTEAERRFEEVRRQRMQQRIAKEARTSHKEKVEAFNKYLGSLSEHHDIPKVGPG
ncbi:uncharacterized protein PSANT_04978 [Moesziomyces antarcticus]|uniref:DUF1754-domain-containing protein n=1 Tax=Pseudozyma antarctica TaxID=84753 RepID=A0A5C3FT23_PSEA2|nr:uncharacterized protein PSANT_04978 [Moesziomyces antarcticus]